VSAKQPQTLKPLLVTFGRGKWNLEDMAADYWKKGRYRAAIAII